MQLSDSAKELIHNVARDELFSQLTSLIRTWGVALGATNILAILVGFVYIFGFLPAQAADQARSSINLEIAGLKDKVIEASSDALLKVGEVHGGVKIVQKDVSEARKRLNEIDTLLKAGEKGKAGELVKLIEQMDASPTTFELLNQVKEISDRVRPIAYTSGSSDDPRDTGRIPTRSLFFSKKDEDTAIRIGYTDNLRVLGAHKGCRWELRVDGQACPGRPLYFNYYSAGAANPHRSRHVVGYCSGLRTGDHEVQVWLDNSPGFSGSDCYTGWNGSTWTLEAEEVKL